MSFHSVTFGSHGLLLFLLVCSGGLGVVPRSHAQVAATEPLERIVEVTRAFVLNTLGTTMGTVGRIDIGQLDNRLRLARCAHLPTVQLAPGTRTLDNGTVNVRCSDPVTWSIFVPVRVEREVAVVVVARVLVRQQVIGAEDVRLESTPNTKLGNGYFDAVEAVIGLQTKRALVPGQIVNESLVTQTKLVKRGQQVTLFSAQPGLMVQMKGEALEDGVAGQRIRVRNLSSQHIVEGDIEASGMVRVAP